MRLEGVNPAADPIDNKQLEKGDYPEDDLKGQEDASYHDPFGNEDTAEVKYKTLKWW